jgi:hypothetical protein
MTAAIFLQGYSGSVQRVTEEKNFIAGGAYTLTGAEEEGMMPLTGPITVSDNRFARCLGTEVEHECAGAEDANGGGWRGEDSHGWFPNGGVFGIFVHFNNSLTGGTGNFWDNNLDKIPVP